MNKFLLKNEKNFDDLNKYIDDHYNDIRIIITSPELFQYFKECYSDENDVKKTFNSEFLMYRGKRMIVDDYCPAPKIYFLRKSNSINFNLPCICGIYSDEEHQ